MINVYTTIDGLKLNKNVCLMPYKKLSDNFIEWIDRQTMTLMKNSTKAEKDLAGMLHSEKHEFIQQAFFMIDGKSYFLDFFFPQFNVAIELNGGIHNKKVSYDLERDLSFQKIGIKTIRITNDFIYREDFKSKINQYFKKAVNGTFDSAMYYNMNNVNRFKNTYSINQKFILAAIDGIESANNKAKVLIKTTSTYLLSILNHLDIKYLNKYDNQDLIKKFYDVVTQKEIVYDITYCGNRKNIRGKLAKYIQLLTKLN